MNWKIIMRSLTHKDMRGRILAVLGILLIFRILAHIPVPLSNPETLHQVLQNLFNSSNTPQLLSFINVLSGGALANFSIMIAGMGPYINASIIMQLLTKAIPQLEALHKEGEFGQKKINQYTRILTFPLAIIQSIGSIYLIRQAAQSIGGVGDITANSSLTQWVLTWLVVMLNEAARNLTVNYAKRVQGNRTYGGITTTLPVKLITAGVIPIIFAVAFLSVPSFAGQIFMHGQQLANFIPKTHWEHVGVSLTQLFQQPTAATFAVGGWKPWVYPVTYFSLVFVFTYFYTSVTFNAKEIAENLQKQGGFIADVRSGKQTEKYLSRIVNRLTLFGAIALGFLAILPIIAQVKLNQQIAIGGTSILILVSVSLETLRQVESRALMITYDQYEQPDYFYESASDGTAAFGAKRLHLPSIRRKK